MCGGEGPILNLKCNKKRILIKKFQPKPKYFPCQRFMRRTGEVPGQGCGSQRRPTNRQAWLFFINIQLLHFKGIFLEEKGDQKPNRILRSEISNPNYPFVYAHGASMLHSSKIAFYSSSKAFVALHFWSIKLILTST